MDSIHNVSPWKKFKSCWSEDFLCTFDLSSLYVFILLLLLLEALQLQRSFGLLSEFLPFGPVSDAVLPICYFHPCYIALYIIMYSFIIH